MTRRLLIFLIVAATLAILVLTCERCQPDQSRSLSDGKIEAISPPSQLPDTSRTTVGSGTPPPEMVETRHVLPKEAVSISEPQPVVGEIAAVRPDSIAVKPAPATERTTSPPQSAPIASPQDNATWVSFQPSVPARTANPVIEGLLSSFSLPLRDLLVKEHDSEWRNVVNGFSVTLMATLPLKGPAKSTLGLKSEGVRSGDLTLSAAIRYNPLSYWFVGVTFYRYLNSDYKAPWSPEFSYSFGYDDWHPYTLSIVYSNYGGNRLNPNRSKGESLTRFEEGTWSMGWKFVEPYRMEDALVLFREGRLTHSVNYNLTARYFDLKTLAYHRWKQTLSLATNYSIYGNWFAGVTMFYYLDAGSRQPWNPDYTYSFGYFDWRPGKISVRYANYSGNRFPWNRRSAGTGRFKDGSVTVSYGWSF